MKYYFIWNGVNCRSMGIRMQSMPEIIRPEERVNHVVIPGRTGEMTQTEGDDIFNSYIQTIPIAADSKTHAVAAESWLRGAGEVTFCSQPGFKQRARIINAVTFSKHSRNSDWWEAEIQFYCDPVKYMAEEEDIELTESGSTVENTGDMQGFPLIGITGSGAVTVSAGGGSLSIPNCVSGWVIDCENEWVLNGSGVPQVGVCSGNFPKFAPGDVTVTFTGATKLTITPRWRYL